MPLSNLDPFQFAERFQMLLINSTVNSLDICEVCGSYQCPYCPVYSTAHSVNQTQLAYLLFVVYVLFFFTDVIAHWQSV